jgi:gliding motility-associated-like protein
MTTRLKYLLVSLLLVGWGVSFGQVKFGIELMPDQTTYLVSMQADTTIAPPFNITSSVQITMRTPHGEAPNNFMVGNITNLQPLTAWDDNVHIISPLEAPTWDYISFALISLGTTGFTYEEGVSIPLFSFTNEAAGCVGEIELIDNENDPFLPPNSANANIGHSIVVFGAGLQNAYRGNIDDNESALCVPEVPCVEPPVFQNIEICQGAVFDGYYFQNDTTIVRHYFSQNDCDSTVTTQLTVFENYEIELDTTVCLGESYNGQFYFSNTSFTENLTTAEGCDSIVLTNLEILQPAFSNNDTTLCYGMTFAGNLIENDTLIFQTFLAQNGCDSVVNTQVYVTPVQTVQKDTIICAGEALFGSIFVVDTLIEETFIGYNGCDSLHSQINIQVIPLAATTANVIILEGDSYQNFTPSSDTTIIHNLIGQMGCDSIATTNIFVVPPNTTIIDTTICQGQIIQGLSIETDTVLTDTLQTSTTDSIIVTNIQVLPTAMSQTSQTLCYGQIFNGIAWFSDTTFTEVFNGLTTCDSIAITHLNIIGSPPIFNEVSLCAGEPFLGQIFQTDTLITETFTGTSGCDSLVQTALTIHARPEPEIIGQNTFCNGESVALTTQIFDNYQWSNNTNQPQIDISSSGIYSVTVTDGNGCIGSANFEANATEIIADISLKSISCNGLNNDGTIEFLELSGGLSPYIFSINDGNSFETNPVFQNLSAATYNLIIEDANGCQWQNQATIGEAENLNIIVSDDENLNLGDSIRLQVLINASTVDSIIWTPAATLSCTNCETPIAKPLESTTYRVKVMANDGCIAEESVTLTVNRPEKIFLPNVFSPNNDGENDFFYPFAGSDVAQIKSFRIFDRYGGLVFEQTDFQPNNPNLGWDGSKQNQPLNAGVFVWMIEVEFIDGQVDMKQGDVVILK